MTKKILLDNVVLYDDIYSTDERKIGTWLDGKPLYRKIVKGTFGTITQGTNTSLYIPIPITNFCIVEWFYANRGNVLQQEHPSVLNLNYTSVGYNNQYQIRIESAQSYMSNVDVYASIIYTKTTD